MSMAQIPDGMAGELSIGRRGGLEERSNVQGALYVALRTALERFNRNQNLTTCEVVGALQCLILEVYTNTLDLDGDKDEDGRTE